MIMTMRFKLDKSKEQQGWWILTDTANLVCITFKEHEFNETQRVTILDESRFKGRTDCANELAHIMSEMGDYMYSHYYSIIFPTPVFEFRVDDENNRMLLLRNKYPKLTIEIQDECNDIQLSNALKAAGEFVKKISRRH